MKPWILARVIALAGRTPHGVRGLKLRVRSDTHTVPACRTPHGVRGLKHWRGLKIHRRESSHPARGAWIETTKEGGDPRHLMVAPRTGCVD